MFFPSPDADGGRPRPSSAHHLPRRRPSIPACVKGPAGAGPFCETHGALRSPPVPTASTAPGARGTHHKAEEPHHQNGDGDPPQNLEREAGTEKDQGKKQNQKQRNHSYQPPALRMPCDPEFTHQ
ncbi:hypothetical protein GCM10010321_51240 [Streptomyces chartreusis]|nr:hypothetical protein GCM10010321_51240 [Streptomyces chartreusis]